MAPRITASTPSSLATSVEFRCAPSTRMQGGPATTFTRPTRESALTRASVMLSASSLFVSPPVFSSGSTARRRMVGCFRRAETLGVGRLTDLTAMALSAAATSAALCHRSTGRFERHVLTILVNPTGVPGRSRLSGTGSDSRTATLMRALVAPRKAGCPVIIS